MTLYISMNTPSQVLDNSPIDQAITFMATQVALEKRNGGLPTDGPALDITFMLSAGADVPPFNGMRMGGYTEENNTLYFETAVPEGMTRSPNAPLYVTAVLKDVIDYASQYFAEKEIAFDVELWSRAIDNLAEFEIGAGVVH